MSFFKIKTSHLLAALFLMALLIIPSFLYQNLSNKNQIPNKIQTQKACSWQKPATQNCPNFNFVVKTDNNGCPYLACFSSKQVLGETKPPPLVKFIIKKENFFSGEEITFQLKNISGRRIHLPDQISWEVKKINQQQNFTVFSQNLPTSGKAPLDRNQIIEFLWNQKDKWGRVSSPGKYQVLTQIEDQTFTSDFNIINQ
jgi:hypothetical protein